MHRRKKCQILLQSSTFKYFFSLFSIVIEDMSTLNNVTFLNIYMCHSTQNYHQIQFAHHPMERFGNNINKLLMQLPKLSIESTLWHCMSLCRNVEYICDKFEHMWWLLRQVISFGIIFRAIYAVDGPFAWYTQMYRYLYINDHFCAISHSAIEIENLLSTSCDT